MQRMLVVGGCGTIGKLIVEEMAGAYEIVTAGRSSGQQPVDIADAASIEAMFSTAGQFDALVCAAGMTVFARIDEISDDDLHAALD